MTDLDDIHGDLQRGNLLSAMGLAQRLKLAAQQQEIAEHLRRQSAELERVKSLPDCPQCGQKVERRARICHACRAELVIVSGIESERTREVVAIHRPELEQVLAQLYSKVFGVYAKLVHDVAVAGDALRQSVEDLAYIIRPESPSLRIIEGIAGSNNEIARANRFGPTFLRLCLGTVNAGRKVQRGAG